MAPGRNKTKIVIAGIGGVGGYFGSLLAKQFHEHDTVEICFLARGPHLRQIQEHGLKVVKGNEEFVSKPAIATDKPSEIGIADYIILCTKSYDLEKAILQLSPCINKETVLLPLLNGVDSREKIKRMLPEIEVLDGCVYIISRLTEPGVIENSGNIQTLYFGLENEFTEKMLLLERLFKEAAIEAILSENISSVIWEKFIFISSIATATAYYDTSIGHLLADTVKEKVLTSLIEEVKHVALAKHIAVPEDITEKTLHKLKSLPAATTSSMHSDFQSKKPQTELESLSGYVVHTGRQEGVATSIFEKLYQELKRREGS